MDDHMPLTPLSRTLEQIVGRSASADDLPEVVGRLAVLATHVLPECDLASISLLGKQGTLVTLAATGPVGYQLDELQRQAGEGPCVSAASDERWVYTATLDRDERWPRFSRAASEQFGMGSLLACQLARVDRPREKSGSVNLYSHKPDAFTETDGVTGLLIGAFAGVLVDSARERGELTQALRSRDVIGQAKGILMAQHGVSEEEAFRQLVEVSQRFNVKLREVATKLTEDPEKGISA